MKLKIALFESKISNLKRIYGFLSSMPYAVEIYRAANVEAATKIINEVESFDLIILNGRMSPYKKINEHFFQTILSRYAQKHFIFLLAKEEHKNSSELTQIYLQNVDYDPWMQLPFKPIQFYEILEKAVSNLSSFELEGEQKDYFPITWVELLQLDNIPCNTFIQLSNEKYVKVMNANSSVDVEIFDKYRKKGVNRFYIERECFNKNFHLFFQAPLVSRKSFESDESYMVAAQSALHSLVDEFGISEDVVEVATEFAEETYAILEKNKLGDLLSTLKEGEFIYDHSFLLSLICLETAKKFRWYSSKHNKIICLAALLHDTGIKNNKFHAIELTGVEKLAELSDKERKEYIEHPTLVANQLKNVMDIPSDVIGMVLKHHEGFGKEKSFPVGHYSTQLSALESIFVMSHEVVLLFYRHLFHPDKIELVLANFWSEFHKGNFRKYVKELNEVVNQILLTMRGNP